MIPADMDVILNILAFLLAVSTVPVFAARRIEIEQRVRRLELVLRNEQFTTGQVPASATSEHLFELSPGERLQRGATYRTARGTSKVKLTETYLGLPVIGEAVVLEVDARGHQVGEAYGRLVEGLQEDLHSVEPNLSPEDALNIALTASQQQAHSIKFDKTRDARLLVYVQGTPENLQPSLIYHLTYTVENERRVARPSFYIEANTGSILRRWDGLSGAVRKRKKRDLIAVPPYVFVDAEGGNNKVGKKLYNGKELPQLRVTKLSNTTCSLTNTDVIVYDCNYTYSCSQQGKQAYQFDCDSRNPDYINGAYSPLNDALFFVGVALQMYRNWYEVTEPLGPKGSSSGRCQVRGHFGRRVETAFWNGEYVTIGDGDIVHYPLSSIDVLAHELSHGLTEAHSGLVYEGESGAINEAFSDMAGEVAEHFLRHHVDWVVASDVTKGEHSAIRYFADPGLDGRSVSRASDYCFTMDPHVSSGIFNKVFYVLSHTQGWNISKAFHVFLLANQLYWHPDSDFSGAACDVLQAGSDLDYEKEDIQKAFEEVGIEPCKPRDLSVLENPIMMEAKGLVMYELIANVQVSLRYSDLVIYVYGNVPMEAIFHGASNKIHSSKQNSVYDMIESNAMAIHTFHQCLHRPCTVTITTQQAGKVVLNPLAYVTTLIAGGSVYRSRPVLELDFSVPSYVLSTGLRLAFTTEKVGGDLSYYIRHGQPPVVEIGVFDVVGHNSLPTILCTPKAGKYFLRAVSDDIRVTNINVHMYVLLNARRINAH